MFGVSAHVDSMGFKVKTANWKTSLKGEAKAGAGGGCDPQKPHCAPDPRAVLHTRLWVWKQHSKRDKRHLFNPSPARDRRACSVGNIILGQLCRAGGRCKVLESHCGGCRNRGAAWERPTWSQAQQCLSPCLWLMIQGTGMDWMDTDVQVATSAHPQGHPHGDSAACGEFFWVECVAWGAFLQGGKGEEAPKTHLLWRERWRAQNSRGNPETQNKSRNCWKAVKVSWSCPTWLDIQRDVLPLPDCG